MRKFFTVAWGFYSFSAVVLVVSFFLSKFFEGLGVFAAAFFISLIIFLLVVIIIKINELIERRDSVNSALLTKFLFDAIDADYAKMSVGGRCEFIHRWLEKHVEYK